MRAPTRDTVPEICARALAHAGGRSRGRDAAVILRQLVRYALTGVIHNVGGFLLYLLATHFGADPKLAMSVLYVAGVMASFLLNRYWTFGDQSAVARSLARFLIAYLGGYLLNLGILLLFVDHLGYPHQWVQGCAIIGVAGALFLLNRYYVFSANRQALLPQEPG